MDHVEGSSMLRSAMNETSMSQSELARISGVRQPSISQFLSGRISMSDEQIDRLLRCMGRQLVVERRSEPIELTRSERRSWLLHRQLASRLTTELLESWLPTMQRNLVERGAVVRGEPHTSNLRRWADIVKTRDARRLRAALIGLDRTSIEMREVSPMSGLLHPSERQSVLESMR